MWNWWVATNAIYFLHTVILYKKIRRHLSLLLWTDFNPYSLRVVGENLQKAPLAKIFIGKWCKILKLEIFQLHIINRIYLFSKKIQINKIFNIFWVKNIQILICIMIAICIRVCFQQLWDKMSLRQIFSWLSAVRDMNFNRCDVRNFLF